MSCRIQEHTERLTRLELGFPCAYRQHPLLTDIEVRHIEIDVRLLWMLGTWPHGRYMIGSELKRNSRTTTTAELKPIVIATGIHFPASDGTVEVRQLSRVATVEGNEAETGDGCHDGDTTRVR